MKTNPNLVVAGRVAACAFVVLLGLVGPAHSRTFLQDKEAEANRLLSEVERANESGDYDQAIYLAKKVSSHAETIQAFKAVQKKHNWLWYRIAYAKYLGAERQAPEEYKRAYNHSEDAGEHLNAGKLPEAEKSIEMGVGAAEEAISITKLKNAAERTGVGDIEIDEKIIDNKKTYEVRFIPGRRDCLWRIAEYEFIYGDPLKWPLIYEANKDKIKDPNLIYPGQKLIIPNLIGNAKKSPNAPTDK